MPIDTVADLLEQAKQAHSEAFAHVDGHDPEWARWYAEWLHPRVAPHLDEPPCVEDLGELLAAYASAHGAQGDETPWPQFYAERLIEQCKGPS